MSIYLAYSSLSVDQLVPCFDSKWPVHKWRVSLSSIPCIIFSICAVSELSPLLSPPATHIMLLKSLYRLPTNSPYSLLLATLLSAPSNCDHQPWVLSPL